jgi:hypothetical protein
MSKKSFIIVFVVLGFIMMPSTVFACGNNYSKKTSCTKEVSSKPKEKDCCDSHNNKNSKQHSGCSGKCGHSNCNIPLVQVAIFTPITAKINTMAFFFYIEKGNFNVLETTISSGFQSLWLIPKIG